MDWFRHVNNYCERTNATYWSEPVNALTNLAFVLAAVLCWRMIGDRPDWGARVLTILLGLIGLGSYLFHTHAQIWSLMADVIPIQLFILTYVYLATVRFFAVPVWAGGLAVLAFIPYAWAVGTAIGALFGPLNGSVGYMPVPILILAYAFALRTRAQETAQGLAIGAGLLALSLFFRTIDEGICPAIPLGTHFLWHILNAIMLGWMIRVLVRHGGPPLAEAAAPR